MLRTSVDASSAPLQHRWLVRQLMRVHLKGLGSIPVGSHQQQQQQQEQQHVRKQQQQQQEQQCGTIQTISAGSLTGCSCLRSLVLAQVPVTAGLGAVRLPNKSPQAGLHAADRPSPGTCKVLNMHHPEHSHAECASCVQDQDVWQRVGRVAYVGTQDHTRAASWAAAPTSAAGGGSSESAAITAAAAAASFASAGARGSCCCCLGYCRRPCALNQLLRGASCLQLLHRPRFAAPPACGAAACALLCLLWLLCSTSRLAPAARGSASPGASCGSSRRGSRWAVSAGCYY